MNQFWTIAAILLVLWLLLEIGGIGGSLIHLLLVIAVIIVVYRLFTGRNVVSGKR
jgi:hypothetical protein